MQTDATTSHTALIGSPRAMATNPNAPAPNATTRNQNIFFATFMFRCAVAHESRFAHTF
jgi:hypothetical protein